jgi:hypothetical protein
MGLKVSSDSDQATHARFVPVCQTCQKKFYWCPVAPTVFQNEPFGENVEGLSHLWDESYAVERPVQTDDFQKQTLFGDIRRKPFARQRLRKFKHFHSQIGPFRLLTAESFELRLQACFRRTQFGLLGCERLGFDLIEQPQVEQPLLLLAHLVHNFPVHADPWSVVAAILLDRTRVVADLAAETDVIARSRAIAIWQFMNFLRTQPAAKGLPIAGGEVVIVPDEMLSDTTGQIHMRRVRTGHKPSKDEENLAAAVFHIAASEHTPGCTVQLVYLSDASVTPVKMTDRVLRNRADSIAEKVAAVKGGYFPINESITCPRCPAYFVCGRVPSGTLIKKISA